MQQTIVHQHNQQSKRMLQEHIRKSFQITDRGSLQCLKTTTELTRIKH